MVLDRKISENPSGGANQQGRTGKVKMEELATQRDVCHVRDHILSDRDRTTRVVQCFMATFFAYEELAKQVRATRDPVEQVLIKSTFFDGFGSIFDEKLEDVPIWS